MSKRTAQTTVQPKAKWHPCEDGLDPIITVLLKINREIPVIPDAMKPVDLVYFSKQLAAVLDEHILHVDGTHFKSLRFTLMHWLSNCGFGIDSLEFNDRMQRLLDSLKKWERDAENLILPMQHVPQELREQWDEIVCNEVVNALGHLKQLRGTVNEKFFAKFQSVLDNLKPKHKRVVKAVAAKPHATAEGISRILGKYNDPHLRDTLSQLVTLRVIKSNQPGYVVAPDFLPLIVKPG